VDLDVDAVLFDQPLGEGSQLIAAAGGDVQVPAVGGPRTLVRLRRMLRSRNPA
jgi:hypothetical protein